MAAYKHFEILPSAARTATVTGRDRSNFGNSGLRVVIDATVDPAAAAVTFKIEGKDPLTDTYYTVLESAAVDGVETVILKVFPGATPATNVTANDHLPAIWRLVATAADSDSLTYSVSGEYLV